MSEPTLPDKRTKALPHEYADVSVNVLPAELVLEEIRSTRVAWTLCEAGKLPIDYAAEAKNLWNLYDERIGAPPDIGEVKDEQQARMALRLMEAALTPTAADSDSAGGMKPDSTATAELTAVEMVQKLLCQARMEAERGGAVAALPVPAAQPKKLLTDWREITTALEMKYADREKVKSLNERYQGPIKHSGKGTNPMVYQDDLIQWWNKLAIQQQELANQREGAKLSAEAQHNYGSDGTAAPEIGGGVKKRRRDKRT